MSKTSKKRAYTVKFVDKFLDFTGGYAYPIIGCFVFLFSFLAGYDFSQHKATFPRWIGVLDILDSRWMVYGFIVLLGLQILLSCVEPIRHKRISRLKERLNVNVEINQALGENIKSVFDGILFNFSVKLEFGESERSRISLYVMSEDGFVPCGRYAPNPSHRQPGSSHYPVGEGCIGRGWDQGWYFANDFPEERSDWVESNVQQYDVPREVAEALARNMQSRLFAVKRLADHGRRREPIAVLVVESEDPERFDPGSLRQSMEEFEPYLAEVIVALNRYIPLPSEASGHGF